MDKQPSSAFAAIAYDATDALMQATKDAYRAQRSGDPNTEEIDRTGVALALERLGSINGASGLVMLHSAANSHHARQRPVMLVHIRLITNDGNRQAQQIVVAQCGKLYDGQSAQPSCPQMRVCDRLYTFRGWQHVCYGKIIAKGIPLSLSGCAVLGLKVLAAR